jgi:hypothetical protein
MFVDVECDANQGTEGWLIINYTTNNNNSTYISLNYAVFKGFVIILNNIIRVVIVAVLTVLEVHGR